METKKCRECRTQLHNGARRCHSCHEWQDWRRFTGQLTVLALLPIGLSIIALLLTMDSRSKANTLRGRVANLEDRLPYELVYEKWQRENQKYIEETGNTGKTLSPISILWYQFFEKGVFLYNASSDWSIALFPDKHWEKYNNPTARVTLYDPENPNIEDNIRARYNGPNFDKYLQLFLNGEITGGIGTLYVEHDLFPSLGAPLSHERVTHDAGYVSGPVYDLLIGLVNTHLDSSNSRPKAVYSLIHKGKTYSKFVVYMDSE